MTTLKENSSRSLLPFEVESAIISLGKNIRIARIRRGLRLVDLAQKIGISRFSLAAIEKGKPSASIGSYVGALWALGLLKQLESLGSPDLDEEGKALEAIRSPKTASKRRKVLDNDF